MDLFPSSVDEEARQDPDAFIRKYFLNAHGQPDPSITPQPLVLMGLYNSERRDVHEAAQDLVPGLFTKSAGPGRSDDRAMAVGWSMAAVWLAAEQGAEPAWRLQAEVERRDAEDREARKRELMRQVEMEAIKARRARRRAHMSFVQEVIRTRRRENLLPFSRWEVVGKYDVFCGVISDRDVYPLRIVMVDDSFLVGYFDFGIVEGIMHLGTDLPHKELAPWSYPDEEEEEEEEEKEEDEEEEDEKADKEEEAKHEETEEELNDGDDEPRINTSTTRKRTAPSTDHNEAAAPKRARTASSNQNKRLYFKGRGREMGACEDENPLVDDLSGHMDFANNACTSAKGVISLPVVGDDVQFTAYKISTDGGEMTDEWDDYMAEEYE